MQTIHHSRFKPSILIYRALAWIFLGLSLRAAPFTYQGQLNLSGKPASGSFDLQVVLYDALTGGNNVGRTNIASALAVNQGAFTVDLDFGSNVFDGNPRWLEISVRTNGASDFTVLAPRQAINAVPYAQYALTPAGPQGPAGPKGDKGDPGSFPTTGTIGINVAPFLPNTALQLAPVNGSGGALTIGGNPVGTILELGLTDPNHGESYVQSVQQQGTWGELQLSPNGGGVAIGKNGGGGLSINGDIQISGTAMAQRFVGDGSGLTNLNIPPGLTGPAGPQGPQGLQGLQGQPGPQGPPGMDGAVGPQGPTGPVGINWTGNFDFSVVYKKGDAMFRAGSSWISLIDHSQAGEDPSVPNYTATDWAKLADHGADGMPGPAGPQGLQGLQGQPGPQGVAGPIGPQGVPGTDGAIGPQGPSGPVGPAGPKGDKGDAVGLTVVNRIFGWGLNDQGETDIPAGLSGVTAISAGGFHSLALKSDGTVVAWGDSNQGQIEVPVQLSGVTAISGGGFHSLALKSDGTVVAWGDNESGQTNVPVGLSGVTAIAAGDVHSLALKNDGTVVAWGLNNYSQAEVPVGLSGVAAISAGGFHSLALKNDGTVVAWGRNDSGQARVPVGLSGVTAISAGYEYSLALKNDGTVVAWGSNDSGQASVPMGLSGVTAISAGWFHSLALKSDGTVVGWGIDTDGEIELPAGLSGVTAISAGGYYSIALNQVLTAKGQLKIDAISVAGGLQIGGPLSGGNGLNITGSVATTGSVQIAGQDAATGDSETLKMIRGVILSNGTVLQGRGYSVTHVSTGDYIVTFANPFDAANGGQNYPAVTVTPINAEGCTCTVNYTKAGSFEAILNGPNGKRADLLFSFIALGVR